MSGERRIRILAELSRHGGSNGSDGDGRELDTSRLCGVCAHVTATSGAAIVLLSRDVAQGSVCSTGEMSTLLERLQFDLGEGPCVDAYDQQRPVVEPDLAQPRTPRWPAFAQPAVEAGVSAVFAFPLRVGAVRLGALQLHRERPGGLSDDEHADALVMADVAAEAVLVVQSDAPPGVLASTLEASGDFRYVVHQASGMVAAQLEVGVATALVRLRAHAFGNDQTLVDVATAVVARTLRFDPNDGADGDASQPDAYP